MVLIMSRPLATTVVAFGFSTAANAVDIVNEDPDTHQIVVTDSGESTSFELASGRAILDLCEKCSVQIDGTDSATAEGDQVAVIKDGKIDIRLETY